MNIQDKLKEYQDKLTGYQNEISQRELKIRRLLEKIYDICQQRDDLLKKLNETDQMIEIIESKHNELLKFKKGLIRFFVNNNLLSKYNINSNLFTNKSSRFIVENFNPLIFDGTTERIDFYKKQINVELKSIKMCEYKIKITNFFLTGMTANETIQS